jgi:hypothetical protein
MKLSVIHIIVAVTLFTATQAVADEALQDKRIDDLEKRVSELERQLEEINGKERWKDPAIWGQLKKDMSSIEVRKILGSPARVEEAIFTTWYYHATSKLHSFVWFDEGKVLGWEVPK